MSSSQNSPTYFFSFYFKFEKNKGETTSYNKWLLNPSLSRFYTQAKIRNRIDWDISLNNTIQKRPLAVYLKKQRGHLHGQQN